MEKIKFVLESRKKAMLSEYSDQQALTFALFAEISNMLQEDFEAITQKKKRLKTVFSCIADVLEKAQEQNVKKKYATDLLDVLLDTQIVSYMGGILEENIGLYTGVIKGARSELFASQWSDVTSNHWQRAISRFQM